MEKKLYIAPIINMVAITEEMPIALSNNVSSTGVNLNPETMSEGDGTDASRACHYSVWDD